MVVNVTKISQKMQKKNWLNLEKILQNEKKLTYYSYKKLLF